MSYPPPGGYAYPPPSTGYPPQQPAYGQSSQYPTGYGQPNYQQPQSSIGFDSLNQPQQVNMTSYALYSNI